VGRLAVRSALQEHAAFEQAGPVASLCYARRAEPLFAQTITRAFLMTPGWAFGRSVAQAYADQVFTGADMQALLTRATLPTAAEVARRVVPPASQGSELVLLDGVARMLLLMQPEDDPPQTAGGGGGRRLLGVADVAGMGSDCEAMLGVGSVAIAGGSAPDGVVPFTLHGARLHMLQGGSVEVRSLIFTAASAGEAEDWVRALSLLGGVEGAGRARQSAARAAGGPAAAGRQPKPWDSAGALVAPVVPQQLSEESMSGLQEEMEGDGPEMLASELHCQL
jgi:hypothetical protein